MDIVGKKYLYFVISILIIIPGIFSLALYGLNLSIDFTGGSRLEYQVSSIKYQVLNDDIKQAFNKNNIEVKAIQSSGENQYIIRTKPIDEKQYQKITLELDKRFDNVKPLSFQTIGPTVSSETAANAVKGVFLASLLIVGYIAWSFRKVPKPASSWRFAICTIVALLHDVLVVVGIFSILGHFFQVEIDSLFITALLTVIGFSVHDTIVVFDRIRENMKRSGATHFAQVVNDSILQTLGRSLNTSLTVLLVLLTLFLFGGESIKWFVVALLVGVTSGTFSSIFNAAPLLVVLEEWRRKRSG